MSKTKTRTTGDNLEIPGGETREEWLAELEFFHTAKERLEQADSIPLSALSQEHEDD